MNKLTVKVIKEWLIFTFNTTEFQIKISALRHALMVKANTQILSSILLSIIIGLRLIFFSFLVKKAVSSPIDLLSKLEHTFVFYIGEKHENPSFNTEKQSVVFCSKS